MNAGACFHLLTYNLIDSRSFYKTATSIFVRRLPTWNYGKYMESYSRLGDVSLYVIERLTGI